MSPNAGAAVCGPLLDNPRALGEALGRLADTQGTNQRLQKKLNDIRPFAEVGEAVTTPQRSVSIRNALDMIRETTYISHLDLCRLLRACRWVKHTPGDGTHRPTMAAVKAGYVERVYFDGNRGYRPAITPTGLELLKYAIATGKHHILNIQEEKN